MRHPIARATRVDGFDLRGWRRRVPNGARSWRISSAASGVGSQVGQSCCTVGRDLRNVLEVTKGVRAEQGCREYESMA